MTPLRREGATLPTQNGGASARSVAMGRLFSWVPAALALATSPLSAQNTDAARAGRLSLQATRVTTSRDSGGPPIVDGRLDDAVWSAAPRAGPFTQVVPNEGTAASERTEFSVVYDNDTLYIGVWCFDSDPRAIIASEMKRDGRLMSDDHIVFVIDTFLDRRNGYLFRVNPNGARDDGLITNNRTVNENWDGIWRARCSRDDKGWYAEVSIPFKTLAFRPGQTVWGVNLERQIRRRNELTRWSGALAKLRIQNLDEAGDLTGLERMVRAGVRRRDLLQHAS